MHDNQFLFAFGNLDIGTWEKNDSNGHRHNDTGGKRELYINERKFDKFCTECNLNGK